VVDPFSAAEKKIPMLTSLDKDKEKTSGAYKSSVFADSDDSSDEDMFKTKLTSRYDKKTPIIGTTRPQTANAALEGRIQLIKLRVI
jgi:hypothetical protein